jgi:hypothetical protein
VPHGVAFEDYAKPRSAFFDRIAWVAFDGEKHLNCEFSGTLPPRRQGMLVASGSPIRPACCESA